MLSGTEFLIAVLFLVALVLMSIIDVTFATVNKISIRRLLDNPRAKAAVSLSALLESRAEVSMSIHIVIQLILVSGAVFLFGAFERRQIPHFAAAVGTVVV